RFTCGAGVSIQAEGKRLLEKHAIAPSDASACLVASDEAITIRCERAACATMRRRRRSAQSILVRQATTQAGTKTDQQACLRANWPESRPPEVGMIATQTYRPSIVSLRRKPVV